MAEKINHDTIAADCKLYSAALAIAQHNSLATIVGGIFNLRRAWLIYEETYSKLKKLLNQETDDKNANTNTLTKKNVEKLLASVCFGYGSVQLCFSFLGSYLMKIANFLGKHFKNFKMLQLQ